MKKSLFLVIIFLGNIYALAPSTVAQHFVINSFHADVTINEKGTVDIVETITVTFDKRRHGIYREIPVSYRDDLGNDVNMPIIVHSVANDNGDEWKWVLSREGNVINVRIGDKGKFVLGEVVYVISYTVENALQFFDSHDELYWNVTGNHWRAQIYKATASVKLVPVKENITFQADCYTGWYGSTENECISILNKSGANFQSTGFFQQGDGFTIALGFDKGLVKEPSDWQKAYWKYDIGNTWIYIFPFLSLFYMIYRWYRYGRDPETGDVIAVHYQPPAVNGVPLTAAEAGSLIDERLDPSDLTGSLVGLAVKGFVEISEKEIKSGLFSLKSSTHHLKKLKDPDSTLTLFEQKLMLALFPQSRTTTSMDEVKSDFHTHINKLRRSIFNQLKEKGCFTVIPSKVKQLYGLIGIIVMIALSILYTYITRDVSWHAVLAGVLTGLPVLLFAGAMPVKTKQGARLNAEVKGFREFMTRTDKDWVDRLGKDAYYEYMPYAIALNVVDQWSSLFEGAITSPPTWYRGTSNNRMFTPIVFGQTISSASSHIGSMMFTAPRGSGLKRGGSSGGFSGGGGGFSGGGGGGGGGGSW